MRALKGNKEYTVDEKNKQQYLEQGYDVYNDNGNLLEYSPYKKIAYSEYAVLLEKYKKLESETKNAKLAEENKTSKEDLKAAQKDLDTVKKKLEDQKKAGE